MRGEETALAALFPTETVFERYAAACLRRYLDKEKYVLRVQDTKHWLFDAPSNQFRLRPDLVILHKSNGKPLAILDTKSVCDADSVNVRTPSPWRGTRQEQTFPTICPR